MQRKHFLHLVAKGDSTAFGLQGEQGAAMLQLPPEVETAVVGHCLGGYAGFEQLGLQGDVPTPRHDNGCNAIPLPRPVGDCGIGLPRLDGRHCHRLGIHHLHERSTVLRKSQRRRGRHKVSVAVGKA